LYFWAGWHKYRKASVSCPSVRMYQRVSHWRDVVKLDVSDVYENLRRNSECGWYRIAVSSTIHRDARTSACVVDNSTKCFAARQQCKGNTFLRLRGNTERFCTVDSYMWGNNNTECTHCCVPMTEVGARTGQCHVIRIFRFLLNFAYVTDCVCVCVCVSYIKQFLFFLTYQTETLRNFEVKQFYPVVGNMLRMAHWIM
jgi:hypothetical protein